LTKDKLSKVHLDDTGSETEKENAAAALKKSEAAALKKKKKIQLEPE
jgi:hypothetical protein